MIQELDTDDNSVKTLRHLLEEKKRELEETHRHINKLEKQLKNANRFNDDLQNQVKVLNAKLSLQNEYLKCAKSNVGTQTDDCSEIVCETGDDKHSNGRRFNDWLSASNDCKTSVADLVRETAEGNCSLNDYVYDSSSRTYFSRSTGWYYYPETKVFFDPRSKNYYKYDEKKKSYEFYASLVKSERNNDEKIKNKKNRRKASQNEIENTESAEEEGEIESSCSSDASIIEISDEETVKEIDFSCVRMIVRHSTTLDEGSLLLITCKGAKIGNDEKCEVYIPDECVSKLHAEVSFNEKECVYYLKDKTSVEGSFICDEKLEPNELYALKHGDVVRFGVCELLIHIHNGRDVTCIHCEPGCVQASLKSLQKCITNVDTSVESNVHRKQLNALKKKYGINTFESKICIPGEYKDRAEERRQTLGSDNPYEKTGEGASHDKPLTVKNKGFKMMKKMGWVQGHGLGKAQSGRLSPVQVDMRPTLAGLGYNSTAQYSE